METKACRKGSLNLKNLTATTDINKHYISVFPTSISYIQFLSLFLIKAKEVSTAEYTTEKSFANLQLFFKKLKLFPLQFPIISDVCTRFYIPAKLVLLRMTQIDPFILVNRMKFLAGNSQEHSGYESHKQQVLARQVQYLLSVFL